MCEANSPKSPPKLLFDEATYTEGCEWVKRQRGIFSRSITDGENLDIIALQLGLRYEAYIKSKLPGRPVKTNFTETVAKLLRRSNASVIAAWNTFLKSKTLTPSRATEGPRGKKLFLFKRTQGLSRKIRDWLFERRAHRTRTVAKDVLGFLIELDIIPATIKEDAKAYATALRATQRYIKHLGYKRGKGKNSASYEEREMVTQLRNQYVINMTRFQKTRRIIYTDESYMHQHYKGPDDSLFDPTDDRPIPREKHKGKRFCFIAAIISADPNIPEEQRTPDQKAHLLKETIDIFSPDPKKHDTKDYHGMFDSKYFKNWMEKLLIHLRVNDVKNVVIVLDNASYHKFLREGLPKSHWRKAQLIAACPALGINLAGDETREFIWSMVKQKLDMIEPEIVEMARKEGLANLQQSNLVN